MADINTVTLANLIFRLLARRDVHVRIGEAEIRVLAFLSLRPLLLREMVSMESVLHILREPGGANANIIKIEKILLRIKKYNITWKCGRCRILILVDVRAFGVDVLGDLPILHQRFAAHRHDCHIFPREDQVKRVLGALLRGHDHDGTTLIVYIHPKTLGHHHFLKCALGGQMMLAERHALGSICCRFFFSPFPIYNLCWGVTIYQVSYYLNMYDDES
jgi:hypothetical protein